MPAYARPALPNSTYYSPDGEPIRYGQRWGEDGPLPDTYSVLTRRERFAGLHDVARALISHLEASYDVQVELPPCSRDACDETAESAADRLEMLLLAVAAGGYSERYPFTGGSGGSATR